LTFSDQLIEIREMQEETFKFLGEFLLLVASSVSTRTIAGYETPQPIIYAIEM